MTSVIDPQLELLSVIPTTVLPALELPDTSRRSISSPLTSPPTSSPLNSGSTAGSVNPPAVSPVNDVDSTPRSPKESPPSSTCTAVSQPVVRHPRTILADGVTYQVLHPEDCPDAVTIGEHPKRIFGKNTKSVVGIKRAADETGWSRWEKKRRIIIDSKLCPHPSQGPQSDEDDEFYFTNEPLPTWLNAEREFQPDGRPGVYIVKPSEEDFKNRFEEILEVLQPIGERLGAIKIKVPDACLGPPLPYPDYFAKYTAEHGKDPKEPVIYTMNQYLPLHPHSSSSLAPIYKIFSTGRHLIPISEFSHPLEQQSHRSHIPEKNLLFRGRTWTQILNGNPGGEVQYSSDNDAETDLRSYLGLSDPELCKLPGNVLFQAKNRVTGIHTPYLYLGNAYTLFALHMEDYSALSINYHHGGASKSWRVICPLDFWKIEQLVQDTQRIKPNCSQFVRHASVFMSEEALKTAGIRSIGMQQRKGDLVCTWPMAYHQGWNEGPNICEALAYGGARWKDVFINKDPEAVYKACGEPCEKAGHGLAIRLQFEADGSTTPIPNTQTSLEAPQVMKQEPSIKANGVSEKATEKASEVA
ncbi:JmjC domain, hydroxylase-domain-containing protein [Geopyxis carbonaria]|nr:JmjC domain, hydroxylase-domain-containing protein [Geopyxis carbonaria]